jgi:hypothetical protein
MTCGSMLAAMLDAGPDELAGRGDSPLALHLQGCARCRATASRLLADTQQIVTEAAARRAWALSGPAAAGARRRYVRPLAVGGVLAAAVLVFALLQRAGNPGGALPRVPSASGTPTATGAPIVRKPPDGPQDATPEVAKAHIVKADIAKARGAAKDSLFVGVAVAANVHATVIRTNNPKFTVVWLY